MRRCLIAFALLLACPPVRAVDQGIAIDLTGDVYAHGDPGVQGWFRLAYTLTARPHAAVFLKLAVIVERDSHGDIARHTLYDADDRDLKRAVLRFRDLAVGFRAGECTIVLGRQRLTWGRTTFVNATDNLAPRDWTDPLDEVRLSPLSADITWEHDRWHAEAALVPRYAPSRLPQLDSRWFPTVPGTQTYWGTADFPAVSWNTLQGAVRGGYRGGRGEVTVSYFRGFDDAERLTPRLGPPTGGLVPVYLDRTFPRLEVSGIDGEVLAGSWVFRGEAGYFHDPAEIEDGYALYQVEAEWTQGPWRVITGFGDTVAGGPTAVAATALDVAYLPALFVGARYGEATEWQVGFDATVGTDEWDSYVRLSGSYPLLGHIRLGAELAMMNGAATTFWGRWRDNDRLRVYAAFDF